MGFIGKIIGEAVSDAVGSAVSSAVSGAVSSAIEINKEKEIAKIRNAPKPEVVLAVCPNCTAPNTESLRVCPYCDSLLVRVQGEEDVANMKRN
ncbi:MAG: hypothetical protein K6C99_08785 [Lachnospiraceae bacterium]|nr:hypothetical protein [Lachnospiraceae bacterium]